jgi:hypothetical protein
MGTIPSQQFPSLALPQRNRSTSRRIIFTGLLLVVVALLLWTCGKGMYHNYRLSAAAVDLFHERLDQADYETIYGEATEEFRKAGTREDELKFFATLHEKMGTSGKTSCKGFHVNWQNGRATVSEVFDAQFALGQAEEGFTWVIDQDQVRLQAYRVDSPNLR